MFPSLGNGFQHIVSSASALLFGNVEDGDSSDSNDVKSNNVGQGASLRALQADVNILKRNLEMERRRSEIEHRRSEIERRENQIEVNRLKQHLETEHQQVTTLKQDALQKTSKFQKEVNRLKQNLTIEHRALQKTNTFVAALKENEKKIKRRLGNSNVPTNQLCPVVTMSDASTYQKNIETFCTGYAHIDLNHPGTTVGSTVNLAIMTPWDIPPKLIPELREKARYEISDDCPTPMFTPNDISLQNIDGMDLFVVQLDSTSPNGYLRKELPQCGATNNMEYKPHIPRTTIDVKIWRDHDSCCTDTKDYSVCKAIGCTSPMEANGIQEVKDPWTNLQVGYYYKVTGTTYTASCDNKPSNSPCGSSSTSTGRRRQLLQDEYGNSGERL